MKYTVDDIIDFLNHSDFQVEGTDFREYEIPFDIKPKDFLDYAELDLNSNLQHRFVNALSNAKRALDCQVVCLLDVFGLLKQADKKRWGFPSKIEALKKIGILAPRILTKINNTRNLLEHEFANPNAEQVNDFIDVVALFLESTKIYLENYLNFIETAWINDKTLNIEIASDKIIVDFYYSVNENDEESSSYQISISPETDDFYKIMELYHKKTQKIY
jgi:hypothetical protein